MNILLAFKAEPDAGMLAEKEWQAAAQGNSGIGCFATAKFTRC